MDSCPVAMSYEAGETGAGRPESLRRFAEKFYVIDKAKSRAGNGRIVCTCIVVAFSFVHKDVGQGGRIPQTM
jgi:hypothetical protein